MKLASGVARLVQSLEPGSVLYLSLSIGIVSGRNGPAPSYGVPSLDGPPVVF